MKVALRFLLIPRSGIKHHKRSGQSNTFSHKEHPFSQFISYFTSRRISFAINLTASSLDINNTMLFSVATTLTLAAAFPLTLGSPLLETRQNGVTCQTSDGSPKTGDVTDVINQLRGRGGNCPQKNGEASGTRFFQSPHDQ